MEWNASECEPQKIKQKRILPNWILEGKKSTPKDTEKKDSEAEKNSSRIKEMFVLQKIKKSQKKNRKFPLTLTTNVYKEQKNLSQNSQIKNLDNPKCVQKKCMANRKEG